jgi:hypothetical protein
MTFRISNVIIGTIPKTNEYCNESLPPVTFTLANPPYNASGSNKVSITKDYLYARAGIIGGTRVGWQPGQIIKVVVDYTDPNTAPNASVSISPNAPYNGNTIKCDAQVLDAEQKDLYYKATLLLNNAPVSTNEGQTLNSSIKNVIAFQPSLSVGDKLKCKLDYNDSSLAGPTVYSPEVTAVAAPPPVDCTTIVADSGLCKPNDGDDPWPIAGDCAAITPSGAACCNQASGCVWTAGACVPDNLNLIGAYCQNFNNMQSACQLFGSLGAGCYWIPTVSSCGTPGPNVGTCSPHSHPYGQVTCHDVTSKACCELTTGCTWYPGPGVCGVNQGSHGTVTCSQFSSNPVACGSFGDTCHYIDCAPPGESCDPNEGYYCCGDFTCPAGGGPCCHDLGGNCTQSADCCSGLTCEGINPYSGDKICCMPAGASCVFDSECCSNDCKNHVCQANACLVIPTVSSYTDITLDPSNPVEPQISVFVYNLSKEDYIKTPLPNALVFMVDLTDKTAISMCYAKTGADGRLPYPYDPQFPGCLDYWFIFCPLSAAAGSNGAALAAREICLNSTKLAYNIISPAPVPCDPANPPTGFTNYPEHILSHNVLYLCNKVPRDFAPLCWPLMLILGLLLGANFAVGRNPFAMFDLSSPRLARGRQYSMRTQGKSFDLLSYAMGAVSAYGSVKKDIKSIKEGGFMGPVKAPLAKFGVKQGKTEKQKARTQARQDARQDRQQARVEQKGKPSGASDGGKKDGSGGNESGTSTTAGGLGGVFGRLNIFQGGGKKGRQDRRDARKEKALIDKIKPKINKEATFEDSESGGKSGTTAMPVGAKGEGSAAMYAQMGMSGQNAWADAVGILSGKPTKGQIADFKKNFKKGDTSTYVAPGASSLDKLFMTFSLKNSSGKTTFGSALLAILKLLLNIVLDKYGMTTGNIQGLFSKQAWQQKGLAPVVKNIMELVKLLLALYSIMCEISNYSKSLRISGQGNKAKGFMDDVSDASLFKIGNYNMSTNALLSWLDPRMQNAGTGPGAPYPFGFIVSPILGGLELGLTAAASAIDSAVDKKRHGKGEDAPDAMAISQNGRYAVGIGKDKEGNEEYDFYRYKDGKMVSCTEEEIRNEINGNDLLKNEIKDGDPRNLATDGRVGYYTLAKGKEGTYLPLKADAQKDHAVRLATKVDLKADAGEYLLKTFGGMFSDARREAMAANIGALRTQARAIRDPDSSAADLKMAQDYVNMTRYLMGQINSNDTMDNAIDMIYVKSGNAEADAKSEKESNDKKRAAGTRMEELEKQLAAAAPGSRAYDAAQGEITDIQATLALCALLEAVSMPFDKALLKDNGNAKVLMRRTNKMMQDFFMVQLKSTVAFSDAYFSIRDVDPKKASETKKAIAESFGTFADGFKDFSNTPVKNLGELRTKVDVMNGQLEVAKKGLSGIMETRDNALVQQMASALKENMDATGARVKADAAVNEKKQAVSKSLEPSTQVEASLADTPLVFSNAAKKAYKEAQENAQGAKKGEIWSNVKFYSLVAQGNGDNNMVITGNALLAQKGGISQAQAEDYVKAIAFSKQHMGLKKEEARFVQAISLPEDALAKIFKGKVIDGSSGLVEAIAATHKPLKLVLDSGQKIELGSKEARKLHNRGYFDTGRDTRLYLDTSIGPDGKKAMKLFVFSTAVSKMTPRKSSGVEIPGVPEREIPSAKAAYAKGRQDESAPPASGAGKPDGDALEQVKWLAGEGSGIVRVIEEKKQDLAEAESKTGAAKADHEKKEKDYNAMAAKKGGSSFYQTQAWKASLNAYSDFSKAYLDEKSKEAAYYSSVANAIGEPELVKQLDKLQSKAGDYQNDTSGYAKRVDEYAKKVQDRLNEVLADPNAIAEVRASIPDVPAPVPKSKAKVAQAPESSSPSPERESKPTPVALGKATTPEETISQLKWLAGESSDFASAINDLNDAMKKAESKAETAKEEYRVSRIGYQMAEGTPVAKPMLEDANKAKVAFDKATDNANAAKEAYYSSVANVIEVPGMKSGESVDGFAKRVQAKLDELKADTSFMESVKERISKQGKALADNG